MDWYNHRHHHSEIKFVTPMQRHSGQAVNICRGRAANYHRLANATRVAGHYTQAADVNRRWSESIDHHQITTIQSSYVDVGCLNNSRGVIFPGSHRFPIALILFNLMAIMANKQTKNQDDTTHTPPPHFVPAHRQNGWHNPAQSFQQPTREGSHMCARSAQPLQTLLFRAAPD